MGSKIWVEFTGAVQRFLMLKGFAPSNFTFYTLHFLENKEKQKNISLQNVAIPLQSKNRNICRSAAGSGSCENHGVASLRGFTVAQCTLRAVERVEE